jgi:hypothetical protein
MFPYNYTYNEDEDDDFSDDFSDFTREALKDKIKDQEKEIGSLAQALKVAIEGIKIVRADDKTVWVIQGSERQYTREEAEAILKILGGDYIAMLPSGSLADLSDANLAKLGLARKGSRDMDRNEYDAMLAGYK